MSHVWMSHESPAPFAVLVSKYGVATVCRIDKVTGLFCRISSLLQGSFAKETYDLIDPTNQSHPIRHITHTSHIRMKWVMSHTCIQTHHTHITHTSHIHHTYIRNETRVTDTSHTHHTYITHTSPIHHTYITHTYEWVARHVIHVHASCHTYEWVMRHVTHMHQSRVMSHVCDMTHSYVWHDSLISVPWHIHMRDMAHLHVWHDSFICVTRLIHMCDLTHSMRGMYAYMHVCLYVCMYVCIYVCMHAGIYVHTYEYM